MVTRTDREQRMRDFEAEFLNTFRDPDDLVEYLLNNHRTLQQNFVRFAASFLVKLADQAEGGRFDARNEASVKFATLVRDEVMPEVGGFPII